MTYSVLVFIGLAGALALDLGVFQTRLVGRRAFWVAYAIMLFFQLVMNGILTGLPVVTYRREEIFGLRIVYAPIEDLGFGFAVILTTLTLWVRAGQRSRLRTNGAAVARIATPREQAPERRGEADGAS